MIPEFTKSVGEVAVAVALGPNRMKTGPAGRLKVIV